MRPTWYDKCPANTPSKRSTNSKRQNKDWRIYGLLNRRKIFTSWWIDTASLLLLLNCGIHSTNDQIDLLYMNEFGLVPRSWISSRAILSINDNSYFYISMFKKTYIQCNIISRSRNPTISTLLYWHVRATKT